jgi:hypothetical protein
MSACHRQAACLVVLLASSACLRGGILVYEFSDPVLPPGLTSTADPGYSIDFTTHTGYAWFSGQGELNGFARLTTTNAYTGDFTVVTVARRHELGEPAVLGLAAYFEWPLGADSPFASVALSGLGRIESWTYSQTLEGNWGYLFPYELWFLIERTGNRITTKYATGDEFPGFANFITVLESEQAGFGNPARLGLFLGQSTGGVASGDFDILAIITPDETQIPEPATALLLLCGLAALRLTLQSREH